MSPAEPEAVALFTLVDGEMCEEPDPFAWADWMESTDRTCEIAEGFTPVGMWQVLTGFLGMAFEDPNGRPCFFVTQVAEGPTREELTVMSPPFLATDLKEAMANHKIVLSRFRPSLEKSGW